MGGKKKVMKKLIKQKKEFHLGDLVLLNDRNQVRPARVEDVFIPGLNGGMEVYKPEMGEAYQGSSALMNYNVYIYGRSEDMLVELFVNRKVQVYNEYAKNNKTYKKIKNRFFNK